MGSTATPTWQQIDSGLPLYKELASPLELGIGNLKNRIAMASMTRTRGVPEDHANDLVVKYYRQRAKGGVGLILSEGTLVSMQGTEYPNVPSLYTQARADAWKPVIAAVHEEGALIVAQLWHVGRVAHPDMPLQKKAGKPVSAPSAVAARGGKFRLLGDAGYVEAPPHPDPWQLIEEFRQAAKYAKSAGFDGIELHGAAGYLVQQFLDSGSNVRTDIWGGSTENRARFAVEVLKAMAETYPTNKIGLKLNPCGGFNVGMPESDTKETYGYVIEQAVKLGLAYVQIVRYLPFMDFETEAGKMRATQLDVLDIFGPLIQKSNGKTKVFLNGDLNPKDADELIKLGKIDAAVFGRPWLNNPDYANRVLNGKPLNEELGYPLNFYGFYNFDKDPAEGYTDYPDAEEALKQT